jgi:predicted  nucleic acid-binding Zn-ribbon protein
MSNVTPPVQSSHPPPPQLSGAIEEVEGALAEKRAAVAALEDRFNEARRALEEAMRGVVEEGGAVDALLKRREELYEAMGRTGAAPANVK